MMNKDQKTEYLFSAIGEIDDRFLEEAVSYRRPARRKKYWIPVLAACLAVFFTVSSALSFALAAPVGVFILGLMGTQSQSPPKPQEPENDPTEYYASLDELMTAQREEDGHSVYLSAEELSYFGEATIIWQYEEDGEYCVAPLTLPQLSRVKLLMGRGENVGDRSPDSICRVWICDGKGNVRSPYLKNSAGNVDSAVFDYEPEIIPDEDFVECISDILN